MGLLDRAMSIFQAKTNKLLDKLEDPNASLDLSYEKMLDGLQEIKTHLADVLAEQISLGKKVEAAKLKLEQRDEEAKAALKRVKEDLAKQALTLKQTDKTNLDTLQASYDHISNEVDKLKAAEQRFQQRIEAFKQEKEVTKASYTAAKAQEQINSSLAGAGKAFGGVGETLQRAKDKTEQMQSKAEATDQLTKEGIFTDPLDTRDSVTKELDKARTESTVDDELAALKKQMGDDAK
jgi:phage shock protein A